MASISIQKVIDVAVTLTQNTATRVSTLDVTNFKTVSLQLTKTGAGKGAAKLQWSNDGTNWVDVNSTLNPGAAASVAAGSVIISLCAEQVCGSHVSALFTEDNTGAAAVSGGRWIAKLY